MATELLNLYAAWIGFLLGMISGAIVGLAFHHEQFLGGYGTWPRRLLRLGHIALFGLALINLAFFLTVRTLRPFEVEPTRLITIASWSLIAGAIAMPGVCFAAAFVKPARHLFFIPVVCLIVGVVTTLRVLSAAPVDAPDAATTRIADRPMSAGAQGESP